MLSNFVGHVDLNAALVLIAMFVGLGAVGLAYVIRYRSRQEMKQQFDLAVLKTQADAAATAYNNETRRELEVKKLDQGLITSHVRHDD